VIRPGARAYAIGTRTGFCAELCATEAMRITVRYKTKPSF
jgi:hypothetical protein